MSDLITENQNMEVSENATSDFQVQGGDPGSARAARLREAIRTVGTARAVAERSGVPFGTLQNYLSGGELKLSNAIALAQATGVRLEWLATGEGSMREGEQPPAAPAPQLAPALEQPFRLFGKVRIDRLVQAYEGALASTKGTDRRLTMHLTVVLYDQLSEAAEAEESRASERNHPQRSPQNDPQG